MMHGHEKSDLVIVAVKPANKARKAPCGGVCGGGRSGVGGAKGGGQGEYAPAKHVLDSEPGSRVTGAGAYTATCAVTHPRWEPYAGKPHVRIWCGGRAMKRTSLPLLKRREFITLLGGQRRRHGRSRHAGSRASGRRGHRPARTGAMTVGRREGSNTPRTYRVCRKQGWTTGRNVRIDYRWADGGADAMARYAAELVAHAPDVILAATSSSVAALQRIAGTIPIVFVHVIDPVSEGFVASLARPSGNATGFPYRIRLQREMAGAAQRIAPRVTRAGVIRDPIAAFGIGQMDAIQSMAPSLGVELRPIEARDAGEIERGVTAFACSGYGGLIVLSGNASLAHRELISTLAACERLPAVRTWAPLDRHIVSPAAILSPR